MTSKKTFYLVPARRQPPALGTARQPQVLTLSRRAPPSHVDVRVRQPPPQQLLRRSVPVARVAAMTRTMAQRSTIAAASAAAVAEPSVDELLAMCDDASADANTRAVRRRERLNHLSAQEKQMRRKLKNRVAAQTARDRKKCRTGRLEDAVRRLFRANNELRDENERLRVTCEQLRDANRVLSVQPRDADSKQKLQLTQRSGTSIGSAEGTGDSAAAAALAATSGHARAQAIRSNSSVDDDATSVGACDTLDADDFQQIVDEILGGQDTQDLCDDPQFEHFCAQLLDDLDYDLDTPASQQPSQTARSLTSPTSHLIIAPEYLLPNGCGATASAAAAAAAVPSTSSMMCTDVKFPISRTQSPHHPSTSTSSTAGHSLATTTSDDASADRFSASSSPLHSPVDYHWHKCEPLSVVNPDRSPSPPPPLVAPRLSGQSVLPGVASPSSSSVLHKFSESACLKVECDDDDTDCYFDDYDDHHFYSTKRSSPIIGDDPMLCASPSPPPSPFAFMCSGGDDQFDLFADIELDNL